jgi:peptide/nickel transport system substrate-binding protein
MVAASRRALLGSSLAAAAVTAVAACGGTDEGGAGDTPREGGTLRVGALGSVEALTKDPHGLLSNNSDFLIMSLVYDALTVPGGATGVAPRLAESWAVAEDAKTWTFTIAEGAQFHDGTPVIAADVVASMKRIIVDMDAAFKVPVPPEQITALDDRTVQMVTEDPNSQLPLLLRLVTFTTREGADATAFNGTGPFKLEDYSDGNARLVRFDGWHGPRPLLDAIEVTRFESTDAMMNALQGGQIDLATTAGAVSARLAEESGAFTVHRRPDDAALPIVMRVADGPFADVRVRTAMRLAADREALVQQALSGYGQVANDVLGTGDAFYDTSLPQREQDLDTARELLAEAGFDLDATYTLFTIDEAFGEVAAAKLFAEQAAKIGVQIEVVEQDAGTFYDQTWCKADLYTMFWGTNDSVAFYAQKVLQSSSETNETGWANEDFDRAYGDLLAATDPAAQEDASHRMQRLEYDESGYLLWGMADGIDIHTPAVNGLSDAPGFGWVLLEGAWLAS